MAYCRFGEDSDVYMFHDVNGYMNCCGCGLLRGRGDAKNINRWRCAWLPC